MATRPIRFAAALDLAVTWPLLLPWTTDGLIRIAYYLDRHWLDSAVILPGIDGLLLLFANLTGALAVLWALVRLMRPRAVLGVADAIARLWVAAVIVCYILFFDLPTVFFAFVGTELLGSVIQWPVVWTAWRRRNKPGSAT